MPVAAVAETVATSKILEVFMSALDEVPVKVCNPVKVFATFVTGIFAPAKVVAPVPPLAIGSCPDTSVASATAPNVGAPDAFP